jgi:uncharacterized membrane protein YbhN (UPF0104 family)
LTVGVVLLGVLAWRADLSSVAKAIGDAALGFVLLAVVLILAALMLGAIRWHAYLRALGFEIPVGSSIRLALIGSFFNAFLPTGIGGDTYKALRLPRPPATLPDAFASVLLDRGAGVVGMAVLALIGVVSQATEDRGGSVTLLALITGVPIVVCYGILLILGRRRTIGSATVADGGLFRTGLRLLASLSAGAGDLRASVQGIGVGIATAVLFLGANACLSRALHLSVPLAGLAVLLLLASVVAVLPLSINGVGLREAVYVWGLGSYGVGGDAALAFALLVLATALASSAVGGIVYAAVGGRRSIREG